jgi:hypothetical protein
VRLFGQRSVLHDILHDKGGRQALDAGEPGELLVVELLEGGEVGGGDAQEVVGFPEQALCLEHVRDGGHGLFERLHLTACAVVYLTVGVLARTILSTRPSAALIVTRISGAMMIAIGAFLLVERLAG